MKTSKFMSFLYGLKSVRPSVSTGDAAYSPEIRGIDHAVGLSTLGLIFAIWMAVMAFV